MTGKFDSMLKVDFIIIFLVFATFLAIFQLTPSPDTLIPEERIETAISDVLGNEIKYDRAEVYGIVVKVVEQLNEGQSRRIKYLITAYFFVWLILILYLFRLKQQYTRLHKQIQRLETSSDRIQPK